MNKIKDFFVNIFFSLGLSIKKGMTCLPVLPLVFATLHFSYGIGSLFSIYSLVTNRH